MDGARWSPRLATADDAREIARLLHDFNTEFDTPSPGTGVLADRLVTLLSGDSTISILAGSPAVAMALITMRTNVWYSGLVALLDELYVVPQQRNQGIGSAVVTLLLRTARESNIDLLEINVDEADVDAQRFYERHGFSANATPGSRQRSFYYSLELTGTD